MHRDPVPWLLDPGNPSVRFQTLKHIFQRPDGRLTEEQQRILDWEPVKQLRRHWDPTNFWGRAESPYYGGSAGNFGTLYLLAQLGAPRFEEIEPTCENLLSRGIRQDHLFVPEGVGAAPWHSYAGMALHILTHFGYGDDPRVVAGWAALAEGVASDPERLGCILQDRSCRAGAVKALAALIHCNTATTSAPDMSTIDLLCRYLLAHTYDWDREDAEWARPRFPRFYDTDLVELCHVLAHTEYRTHPKTQHMVERLIGLQDQEGRWLKLKATPTLPEERIFHQSRWLTFEAVHALMLVYGDEMYAP